MNNYYTPSGPKIAIYGLVVACAFLIMAFMVRRMHHKHYPGPMNKARAEERVKARKEITAATAEALNNPGWADEPRGIVRLPIARAMELTLQEYQNPTNLRTNLMARLQKATAPAPKAPEKPSEFE